MTQELTERGKHGAARDLSKAKGLFRYPEVGVPFMWPFSFFVGFEEAELDAMKDNLKYLREIEKTQIERPKPTWATKNEIRHDLGTLKLREFSKESGAPPTFVVAPYAGHTSVIVDFQPGQSLVETLTGNGVRGVFATDWKSATEKMKDYSIDDYLSDLDVCVDELGSLVNLAGMCQGGWLSAMYAARFPEKVNTLTLAGSPIDTSAGNGTIKEYAHKFPMEFFEEIVKTGDGLMRGDYMLEGFKSMHPEKQFFEKYVELYENIEDPSYVKRFESFERWYEYTINLPGRWYLQVIRDLFKENQFYRGRFIGLGKTLSLGEIRCPVYLLAGEKDDITPKIQVFNAEKKLGSKKDEIVKHVAGGGHIGLFMGSKTLKEDWPKIAGWINAHSGGK